MSTAKTIESGQIDVDELKNSLLRFVAWLSCFGEVSYDFQTYYASRLGRAAKALYYRRPLLGTVAVSPMIFCEAFLPSARCLFWKPQRFPIADAHYAMGFIYLFDATKEQQYYERALHFLQVLENTRCKGYSHYCWGYPFDWETRTGTMWAGTPLITTVPDVYEAFREAHRVDGDPKWRQIMRSIAEHALHDYRETDTSPDAASCSYNPSSDGPCFVVNASAYRAFLLTRASVDFSEPAYLETAKRNLSFVIESQNADGSWRYATDGGRDFIDHFHTCFVLKALAKIEAMTADSACTAAINRGMEYYLANLFDESGMPKPFSRRPRLTVYRHELYDYAECINIAVLLRGRFAKLDGILPRIVAMDGWQKKDGSFRNRQLWLGWDNPPMHRWAQAQLFRSLCLALRDSGQKQEQGSRKKAEIRTEPANCEVRSL
jgi:hypothetical protein